jgi:uncharacterized protein (DUF2461 family)
MRVLLEEVLTKVARAFPEPALGDPKVFRIFRDVRFARDKSPYKTHVAGYLPLARAERRLPGLAVLYLLFGNDTYVGAGHWMMDPAQLERYRAALLDDAAVLRSSGSSPSWQRPDSPSARTTR